MQVYGSLADGYIVAPPPPDIESEPPAHDSSQQASSALTFKVAITVDVAGRPTAVAGGGKEPPWKAAVRSALADKTVPPSSRIAIEVEYRLDPNQTGHNAPDLDNLLKATIDALGGVLGPRPERVPSSQADYERIDSIVASKRLARPDETAGARLLIYKLR